MDDSKLECIIKNLNNLIHLTKEEQSNSCSIRNIPNEQRSTIRIESLLPFFWFFIMSLHLSNTLPKNTVDKGVMPNTANWTPRYKKTKKQTLLSKTCWITCLSISIVILMSTSKPTSTVNSKQLSHVNHPLGNTYSSPSQIKQEQENLPIPLCHERKPPWPNCKLLYFRTQSKFCFILHRVVAPNLPF